MDDRFSKISRFAHSLSASATESYVASLWDQERLKSWKNHSYLLALMFFLWGLGLLCSVHWLGASLYQKLSVVGVLLLGGTWGGMRTTGHYRFFCYTAVCLLWGVLVFLIPLFPSEIRGQRFLWWALAMLPWVWRSSRVELWALWVIVMNLFLQEGLQLAESKANDPFWNLQNVQVVLLTGVCWLQAHWAQAGQRWVTQHYADKILWGFLLFTLSHPFLIFALGSSKYSFFDFTHWLHLLWPLFMSAVVAAMAWRYRRNPEWMAFGMVVCLIFYIYSIRWGLQWFEHRISSLLQSVVLLGYTFCFFSMLHRLLKALPRPLATVFEAEESTASAPLGTHQHQPARTKELWKPFLYTFQALFCLVFFCATYWWILDSVWKDFSNSHLPVFFFRVLGVFFILAGIGLEQRFKSVSVAQEYWSVCCVVVGKLFLSGSFMEFHTELLWYALGYGALCALVGLAYRHPADSFISAAIGTSLFLQALSDGVMRSGWYELWLMLCMGGAAAAVVWKARRRPSVHYRAGIEGMMYPALLFFSTLSASPHLRYPIALKACAEVLWMLALWYLLPKTERPVVRLFMILAAVIVTAYAYSLGVALAWALLLMGYVYQRALWCYVGLMLLFAAFLNVGVFQIPSVYDRAGAFWAMALVALGMGAIIPQTPLQKTVASG